MNMDHGLWNSDPSHPSIVHRCSCSSSSFSFKLSIDHQTACPIIHLLHIKVLEGDRKGVVTVRDIIRDKSGLEESGRMFVS